MEFPYTIITIVSATAAIFSAVGSRRSSRVALMANGPGIEVASGVYQRKTDTIGWLTLANVGGSEARDVYIELYHRPHFDGRELAQNVDLPISIWSEPLLRRSTSIQITMVMMTFRETGISHEFEVAPFTHLWVSYKDRLGSKHGYYLPIDHRSEPIDITDLKEPSADNKKSSDGTTVKSIVRLNGPAKYPIDFARLWRQQRYLRSISRWMGLYEFRIPRPRDSHLRLVKTKPWMPFSSRDFTSAFPESRITVAPAIGFFSEDKPGNMLWTGNDASEARRLYKKIKRMASSIGDVEVVSYDINGVAGEHFRLPCSLEAVQDYLSSHDDRHQGKVDEQSSPGAL